MDWPMTWIEPETQMGVPLWWHHHGTKMRVTESDPEKRTITIAGSAATLRITPSGLPDNSWMVRWEVVSSQTEKATGSVVFSSVDLLRAFGFERGFDEADAWLIKQYGGETARQRKFIRWNNFLNIPCPGTGHDGDPNISIYVNKQMQSVIRHLVAT